MAPAPTPADIPDTDPFLAISPSAELITPRAIDRVDTANDDRERVRYVVLSVRYRATSTGGGGEVMMSVGRNGRMFVGLSAD
jgi:hypothetical protein